MYALSSTRDRRVHPLCHPLGIVQLGLGLVQLRVDQRGRLQLARDAPQACAIAKICAASR